MPHLDEEQITALLDNELSPADARQVREHLATCAECAARFEEARGFLVEADRLVRVLEFPEAPTKVQSVAEPAPRPARRPFPTRQLAWAASLLLAIGFGYYGNELRVRRIAAPESQAAKPAAAPAADREADALTETKAAPAPLTAPAPGPGAKLESALQKDGGKTRPESPQPSVGGGLANEQSKDKALRRDESRRAMDAAAIGQVAAAPPAAAKQAAPDTAGRWIDGVPAAAPRERADSASALGATANGFEDSRTSPTASREAFRSSHYGPVTSKVTLEEAVQTLGGSIRLIDGLTPDHVEWLNGRTVAGAQPELAVIRVVYLDAPMRELWLDQQRGKGVIATTDTVLLTRPDGGLSLQWHTGPDGWLSLSGHLTADSLRILARQVR